MKIIFLFFPALFFFASCKQENKIPNDILTKPRMQELLWDMLRADVFINDFAGNKDTAFNRLKVSIVLYQQVFNIHKTDRDMFKKSLNWYQQHPAVMKIILDTLQGRQNRIMQERSAPTHIPDTTGI